MELSSAATIVGELKGLMPMLTEEQARVACEMVQEQPNPIDTHRAMVAYAMNHQQFTLASFRAALPPIPEGRDAWDRSAYDETKAKGDEIARRRMDDNSLCDRLDDSQFDAAAKIAFDSLDADTRTLIAHKPRRNSQVIRSLVADYVRVHRITPALPESEAAHAI